MRPLITHSFNNKIVLSFIAHLPGPPHSQQEAVSPPLNSHRPHPGLPGGPGLWAGVSPFLELLAGGEHAGLICSRVPNAEYSAWNTGETPCTFCVHINVFVCDGKIHMT